MIRLTGCPDMTMIADCECKARHTHDLKYNVPTISFLNFSIRGAVTYSRTINA